MCIEVDRTWTSIEPYGGAKRLTSENRTSKALSSDNFMIHSTSAMYHLSHSAQMDHHLLPTPAQPATLRARNPTSLTALCRMSGAPGHCTAQCSSGCQVTQASYRSRCCTCASCMQHGRIACHLLAWWAHWQTRTQTRCGMCARIITSLRWWRTHSG
jgi:hypothetical protein